MTRDDIMRMAEKAYFTKVQRQSEKNIKRLERFAYSVAALMMKRLNDDYIWQAELRGALREREACARLCENEGLRVDASWATCAAAIRARGQA